MGNNKLTCPVCGEPTNVYMGKARKDRLCRKHGMLANKGELTLCEKCGKWNGDGNSCSCKSSPIRTFIKEVFGNEPELSNNRKTNEDNTNEQNLNSIIIDKNIRCITCGYETDGKLFCKKCYAKYCNKEILIKIKNCREIVPLDDFYEGYFECDDGHVVKSMAEREIDNYLFANNIKHGYEIALPLTDEKGKRIMLHPDFCIFDEYSKPLYYIEYWGYDDSNRDYTKTKKYKLPLYEKAGITLINVNAKTDLRSLKTNLAYKLEKFIPGKINFLNE